MNQANGWTGPIKLPALSWGFLILNKSFWRAFSVCGYVYKWCECVRVVYVHVYMWVHMHVRMEMREGYL